MDVLIHLALEALGALSLRCVLGMCKHKRHRIIAWTTTALIFSIATVILVG